MFSSIAASADVYSADEIGRVAGVPAEDVKAALESDDTFNVRNQFVRFDDAVRLVLRLRLQRLGRLPARRLFASSAGAPRRGGVPMAASSALHAGVLAVVVLITGLGVRSEPTENPVPDHVRLVFLTTPGPGGGGGGGGLKMPRPAPAARVRGSSTLRSPVTVVKKAESKEPEKREEMPPPAIVPEPLPDPVPPTPQPQPTPPVVAPVVSAPSDPSDRPGVMESTAATASHGSGTEGGTGTGRGPGSGEGTGAGIGNGSIAGMGGGPFRPGAGITPPALLREVRPVYTEDGRRRGVEGEVVMEVVVRSDGTVGAVRIVRGLGSGLDQRATDAVRQWRFSPARRHGTPVDVLVEVAVEFRLR
jgi:TonB family protein